MRFGGGERGGDGEGLVDSSLSRIPTSPGAVGVFGGSLEAVFCCDLVLGSTGPGSVLNGLVGSERERAPR